MLGAILKVEGIQVTDCKYCQDEICTVVDVPGVCRFEEREERNEQS